MKTVKARKVRGLQKQYVLNEPIGKGGMAVVYRAVALGGSDEVAIKMINSSLTADCAGARFSQEMRMLVQLDHPHIVGVKDIITEPSPGIVMELMQGVDLHSYLLEAGKMHLGLAARVAEGIAEGLDYAHQRSIVHRDIKPQNILFADATLHHPRICDFGVARFMNRESELTQTGHTVGTISYMSPEQVMGAENIDARADIYSLGVTLYAMVTGELPFGGSEIELMRAHVAKSPRHPSELRDDLPDSLAHVILRALAKDPNNRFKSSAEMATHLRRFSESESTGELDPTIRDETRRDWSSSSTALFEEDLETTEYQSPRDLDRE